MATNSKYQFTNNKKVVFGQTLIQIQATKDFTRADGYKIKEGDLGGFIQNEQNLSQNGLCWLDETSYALHSARILDDALALNGSILRDNSILCERAMFKNSTICGKASVGGENQIKNSSIADEAVIQGKCLICDSSVGDNAIISGEAKIYHSNVIDRAQVKDRAQLLDEVTVMDNAIVCGDTTLCSNIVAMENVYIKTGKFDFQKFLVKDELFANKIHKVNLNDNSLKDYFNALKAIHLLLAQGTKAKFNLSYDGVYHFDVLIDINDSISIKIDKKSIDDLAKIA